MIRKLICLASIVLSSASLFAHERGENYVFLQFHPSKIDGRVEIKIDELKEKLGVDILENGEASIEKIQQTASQVHEYIKRNLKIGPQSDQEFELKFTRSSLFEGEGGWAQYEFQIDTERVPAFLHITHTMCYENDRMHRGIVVLEKGKWPAPDYEMLISMVFSPNNSTQVLDVANPPEVMTPLAMIWQGVLHIWIGIDHVLFLIALTLPIVLVRDAETKRWKPSKGFGKSLWPLIKVITVFTVAHSITLLLASLEIVSIPSRFVESVIAFSIIIVALNNIFGRSHNTSLVVILLLGLFHGLGFASVMAELPMRISEIKHFLLIIVAFNFGVELGQIAILLVAFPLLFALRTTKIYSPLVLTGGSAALIFVAGYWFVERAFGL